MSDILTSGIDFGLKLDDVIVKDFLGQTYVFQVDMKHRKYWIFWFKKDETRTVNIYSPI